MNDTQNGGDTSRATAAVAEIVRQVASARQPGASGILAIDGENPPTPVEVGAKVEKKLLHDPIKCKYSRRIAVIDESRTADLPDELRTDDEDVRKEFLDDCRYDVALNLLNTGDKIELGKMILEGLLEIGEIYDPDTGGLEPGSYDPLTQDAQPGVNRPYMVNGS